MSKGASVLIVAITCTCIGLGIRYLVGVARAGIIITDYSMDLNAGLLKQHINHLAMIRTGHSDESAVDIEKCLDSLITQISVAGLDKGGAFHVERLSRLHLDPLQLAKAYADAGYRNAFSKDSIRILDQVKPIEGKYCDAWLGELQDEAPK